MIAEAGASTKSNIQSAPASRTLKMSRERPAPVSLAPMIFNPASLSSRTMMRAELVFPADIEVPTMSTTGRVKTDVLAASDEILHADFLVGNHDMAFVGEREQRWQKRGF